MMESQVFSLITMFLDFRQAIELQLLNRMMYHRKVPQMFHCIYGSRIEPCIIVYSIYRDRNNAVSALVGYVPSKADERVKADDVVKHFLRKHPLFAQKYEYLGVCWPCVEHSSALIAVFKYRHQRFLSLQPSKMFYSGNDKHNSEDRYKRLKLWID